MGREQAEPPRASYGGSSRSEHTLSPVAKRPPISITDERGREEFAVVLEAELSVLDGSLAELHGRTREGPLHLVISDSAHHERRFPPERAEGLIELDQRHSDGEESERSEGERAEHFASVTYKLGVATAARDGDLPRGAAPGDPTIYLDAEAIEVQADRLGVLPESLLVAVTTHELAHIVRGHHTEGRVVHGWQAERDVQRDAWEALDVLFDHPILARRAVAARAAQFRLLHHQPRAYQYPDPWDPRFAKWRDLDPSAPARWVLDPPRSVSELAMDSLVEVPVVPDRQGKQPLPGDVVFLTDPLMTAGPWIVSTALPASRLRDPWNLKTATETTGSESGVSWLQLRAHRGCRTDGFREEAIPVVTGLRARQLDLVEWLALVRR